MASDKVIALQEKVEVVTVDRVNSIAILSSETTQVVDVVNRVVPVVSFGTSGPPGPIGPKGDPGLAGVSLPFDQIVPAAVWTINHGLGRYPSVTVIDSAGDPIVGDARYPSNNVIVITFTSPLAGTAYLN